MLFKQFRSYFTKKPVAAGYGLSCDDGIHLKVDPTAKLAANPGKLWFYKTRADLGAFEVKRVIVNRDNSITYHVYHADSDQDFYVGKKFFEFVFDPIGGVSD
jgi:hypothetical protein